MTTITKPGARKGDNRQTPELPEPVIDDGNWPMVATADIPATVERHNLQRAGARQPFGEYCRQLWGRWRFIFEYSSATNAVGYSRSFLGQAWQLLTPLLNVGVYYLVFGILLERGKGVHDYIGFLTVGIFVFSFCSQSVNAGSKSIIANLGLTRALHFPRAVLPASTTLVAFQQLLWSQIIMIPIVLIAGERPSWLWFTLIPIFVVQAFFCMGLALIVARIGAKIPDVSQTLPFIVRVWMYGSGVMFSIDVFLKSHKELWVKILLEGNPAYSYVQLARHALVAGNPVDSIDWLLALGWAVLLFTVGFVYFWRGEEEYGNV